MQNRVYGDNLVEGPRNSIDHLGAFNERISLTPRAFFFRSRGNAATEAGNHTCDLVLSHGTPLPLTSSHSYKIFSKNNETLEQQQSNTP